MLTRRSLLSSLALGALTNSALAALNIPQEGKDYLVVKPPVTTSHNKIDVIGFFAYTCPHCLRFEPTLMQWAKTLPKDVNFHYCPVSWDSTTEPLVGAYYTLKALGRADLHPVLFDEIIYRPSFRLDALNSDIATFMQKQGIKRDQWLSTSTSFGVASKIRLARKTWKAYQIDATPFVGVAGRYITAPHLVGSFERMPQVLDFLIAKAR